MEGRSEEDPEVHRKEGRDPSSPPKGQGLFQFLVPPATLAQMEGQEERAAISRTGPCFSCRHFSRTWPGLVLQVQPRRRLPVPPLSPGQAAAASLIGPCGQQSLPPRRLWPMTRLGGWWRTNQSRRPYRWELMTAEPRGESTSFGARQTWIGA